MAWASGTGYGVGRAHGVLRQGPAQCGSGDLAVLTQDELVRLERRPAGLVVVGGAPLSHAVIAALAHGVPTVLLDERAAHALPFGSVAVIDAYQGRVAPAAQAERWAAEPEYEPPRPGTPIASRDGTRVALRASVADAAAARRAVEYGATGIGLVRSEFLGADRAEPPDQRYYRRALQELCSAAHPLPVTVRLIDIADDKRPRWLPEHAAMRGPLGLQGSRLYDTAPVDTVLRAQLEATAALGREFDLSLLIPYVATPDEFERWRRLVEDALPSPMAVGSMAETPAAVLDISRLLATADFVSIGCNDLMQCLFAADRDVPQVGALLDPYAPVVFRLLRQAAQAAGDHLDRVQVCGLLPQFPGILPVLIGLGYRSFSVEPALIPFLASVVAATDSLQADGLAAGVCALDSPAQVRAVLGLPGREEDGR